MDTHICEIVNGAIARIEGQQLWGLVRAIESGVIHIEGLGGAARIGDRVRIEGRASSYGEIIAIRDKSVLAMSDAAPTGMSPGDHSYLIKDTGVQPCDAWIGEVLSSDGTFFSGGLPPQGTQTPKSRDTILTATQRRGLGERLNCGLAPFDTFLPICRGQRVGLFAGSGVGKSSLLGEFANNVEADVVVVALIGERSREVREFVEETLDDAGRARSIVFASTCDEPAPSKRRCANLAITTAEYFRDQGKHVLLLFDSLTRFADAHREISLTAGETPSLRAYPPSTFRAIAELAERPGPGANDCGDITAIFSVLVAASDMDEPIADMVRGILDGHFVLDREIAERGRFPAINIRRSVSRCLPKAASTEENEMLRIGRRMITTYEEASAMIQTGLYAKGSDDVIDQAIAVYQELEALMSERAPSCADNFEKLAKALGLIEELSSREEKVLDSAAA